MNSEELKEYVDFKKLYSDIRESHLKSYPTPEDFFENYEYLDKASRKRITDMYNFITNEGHDQYLAKLELDESCEINTFENILTIGLVEDLSTNCESGLDPNYNLFLFSVDVEEDTFIDFDYEH